MSCCVNSLILPCTHLLFTSQSISIYITLYTPVVYQSVHIYLYYPIHACCLPVSPYLSILPCTHLLFTSQSISFYITLYTPVVYQSVHIFLLISSCPLPPLCEENISSWILVLTCPAPTCLGDAVRNSRNKWSYYWSMIFSCLVINCYFLVHLIGLKNPPPNYGNSSEVERFQSNDIGSLYTRPIRKTWELLRFT